MIDLYTKAVLTVIALALCVIAARGSGIFGSAVAQGTDCGRMSHPCHVRIDSGPLGLLVQVR